MTDPTTPTATDSDTTTTTPDNAPAPPPLDWGDPAAVRRWIDDVRCATDDIIAAGRDATRRKYRRVLSRHEAKRQIRAADALLDVLYAMAMPADEAPSVRDTSASTARVSRPHAP